MRINSSCGVDDMEHENMRIYENDKAIHRHLPWVLWWHSKLRKWHHVFMTHGDQLAFDLWVDLLSAACSASVAPSFLSPDSHELGLVDHWSSYAQLEPVGSTCRIHANGQRMDARTGYCIETSCHWQVYNVHSKNANSEGVLKSLALPKPQQKLEPAINKKYDNI